MAKIVVTTEMALAGIDIINERHSDLFGASVLEEGYIGYEDYRAMVADVYTAMEKKRREMDRERKESGK